MAALKNFKRKYLQQSFLVVNLQLKTGRLVKKGYIFTCFVVNFEKLLRASLLQDGRGRNSLLSRSKYLNPKFSKKHFASFKFLVFKKIIMGATTEAATEGVL